MSDEKGSERQPPITIKKYANRRLYNTATSSYVTLDHLCQMVKEGTDFVVYDAKTGDDITRSVLTQIIVEEESKGQNMLPVSFLRQLISFYGDSLQGLVPRYLEYSMGSFARNQEQMRGYLENMQNTFGNLFPFGPFDDMGQKNMAMFEQAMKMLTPFGADENGKNGENGGAKNKAHDSAEGAKNKAHNSAENGTPAPKPLTEIEAKLAELQRQFDALAKKKGG